MYGCVNEISHSFLIKIEKWQEKAQKLLEQSKPHFYFLNGFVTCVNYGSVNFSPVQSHFLSIFHKSNLSATHKYCFIAFKKVGFLRNSDPAF